MSEETSTPLSSASGRQRRWMRLGLSVAVVAAGWTAGIGWLLPNVVKPRIETAATQALGVPVSMSALHVHPWTLTVQVDGLSVGPAAAPLLKAREASARLSVESIWRFAPVLRRVTVVGPEVYIERIGPQRFNFSPLIERLQSQSKPQPANAESTRFAVYNITIAQGRVAFTDRVLGQSHLVDKLSLGVPFISSLPSYTEVDVQPYLSAVVDGSQFKLTGRAHPFEEDLASTVDVHWSDVNLAQWLAAAKPFLPASLGLNVQTGVLAADLSVTFARRSPPAVALLAVKGGVTARDVAAELGGLKMGAGWKSLQVAGVDALPLERQARIGSIRLDGMRLSPHLPDGGALPKIGPVSATVDGLDTHEHAQPAKLMVEAHDEHGSKLTIGGTASLASQSGELDVRMEGLKAVPWLTALRSLVDLPVNVTQGAVDAALHVKVDPARLSLSGGQLKLAQFASQGQGKGAGDHVNAQALSLSGLAADVALVADGAHAAGLQSVSVDTVLLEGLDAVATRGHQGDWLLVGGERARRSSQSASAKPVAASDSPQVQIKSVQCKACAVAVVDQTVMPAARFSLRQTQLTVSGVSHDLSKTLDLDLETLAQGSGRIKVAGTVRPQPLQVKAKVSVAGLDLKAVQSYLDPYVNMELASAKASMTGRVQLEQQGSVSAPALNARYQGRVALQDVRTLDAVTQADFLRWRTLSLDGVDVALKGADVQADLGKVALQDFYGRIIINPNGQLNVAEIVGREQDGAAKSLTTPQAAPSGAQAKPVTVAAPAASSPASDSSKVAKAPMNLRWQGITLNKGRVDFTDNYIKPNYSARLTRIEGTISAVASTKPEPATVKVSGTVDDSAPMEITGLLHPLGPRLYTDIKGSAKGIELTRLTPYAARYAGYAIEKGSLTMSVQYKVDQGKLEAQNQIFLDQLTFGERVDSPDATKLPVLLAVSLLKNSRGEIDVNLPISGSLDDPQFSVGGIIWRVVVNLLTKAITAPFSLLFGGGHDDMGFVAFEPGSARLTPQAAEKLDKIADKLTDKASLKIEATGRSDPAVDVEGLRHRYVNSLMRKAKARELDKMPDEVTIGPEERDRWLLAAYKASDIKKPRNLVGLAKTLPAADMERLLEAAAATDEQALHDLANRRGDQVKAYLTKKLPAERVLLTASKVGTDGLPDDKGASSRVQLSVR